MATYLQLENRHSGEILRLCRVRDAGGKVYMTLDGSLPPGGSGPPPHIHFHEHEEGIVKKGTLGARVGDRKFEIPAGGTAVLPRGEVHTWWNASQDTLEFGGHVTPVVDLDRYLQAVFAIINAAPPGRPSIFYMAHVSWRHRRTQALENPPRLVQQVVFPLVILLGHLLGKYRGDGWPGAPASITGAPEVGAAPSASAH